MASVWPRLAVARRVAKCSAGAGAVGGSVIFGYLYATEPGVRRSVRFWRQTGPIVASYWWAKTMGSDDADREARYELLHEKHSPAARETIEDLRGMFVKVAQVMSVRPEVVPEPYRREFRKLQDEAPPSRWEPVRDALERDLGAPVEQLFEAVEKVPLGAASIGQAHLVQWRGRQAVVKVQYPDAEAIVRADFRCLRGLLWMVRREALPVLDQVQTQFEIELDFEQEATHLRELHACISAAPEFKGKVVVPAPIPELTHGRVIGMDYLPGPKLETALRVRLQAMGLDPGQARFRDWLSAAAPKSEGDGGAASDESGGSGSGDGREATPGPGGPSAAPASLPVAGGGQGPLWQLLLRLIGVDRALWLLGLLVDVRLRLAKLLGRASAKGDEANVPALRELRAVLHTVLDVHGYQLFFCPYFNADPHPGNVLLLPDGRVGLIDFGQCRKLSQAEQAGLAELILAVAEPRSPESDARVAKAFAATGIQTEKSDGLFNAFLPRLMFCRIDAEWLTPGFLRDIFHRDRVVHWPVHMVMAYRTAMLLRGLCLSLQENVSVADAWRPWAEQWLTEAQRSGAASV